jgi:hypothetical protein
VLHMLLSSCHHHSSSSRCVPQAATPGRWLCHVNMQCALLLRLLASALTTCLLAGLLAACRDLSRSGISAEATFTWVETYLCPRLFGSLPYVYTAAGFVSGCGNRRAYLYNLQFLMILLCIALYARFITYSLQLRRAAAADKSSLNCTISNNKHLPFIDQTVRVQRTCCGRLQWLHKAWMLLAILLDIGSGIWVLVQVCRSDLCHSVHR